MADRIGEDVLAKTGRDLFQELLRLYPVADYEDYFKNGLWRNDLMKLDIQILATHRGEGGAPEPLALANVKLPDSLPQEKVTVSGLLTGTGEALKSAAIASQFAAQQKVSPVPSPLAAGFREMALFVAKWKLDPMKTKLAIGPMEEKKRSYVIQKFNATVPGLEAQEELEKFIAECEKTSAWKDHVPTPAFPAAGAGITPAALGPKIVVPPQVGGATSLVKTLTGAPAGGITAQLRPAGMTAPAAGAIATAGALNAAAKRPLVSGPTPLADAAKRPKLGMMGMLSPGLASSALRPALGGPLLGGARPQSWSSPLGALRPAVPKKW